MNNSLRVLLTRERIGWIVYDWANSAFVLCVITVLGSAFFVAVFEKAAEEAGGLRLGPAMAMDLGWITLTAEAAWSLVVAAAALFVAVSSPILGAIADARGTKKKFLQVYWLLGVVATLSLWFPLPWWGIGLLIMLGNIGFEGGNVFYNAFLPQLAKPGEQDLLSSAGFSAGYLGGVLVLIASLGFFVPPRGSITHAFLLIGLWWGAFGLVTFALLPEYPSQVREKVPGRPFLSAWRENISTVKNISRYPQAALFLLAFLLYNDGIATVISNATPYAMQNIYLDETMTQKIGLGQLIPAIIMIQLIAVPSSLLFGWIATRFSEKTALYLAIGTFLFVVSYGQVVVVLTEFYVMAFFIGMVLGGSQAISRSLFASLIPTGKQAEFFAFYALSSKFSAFAGPMIYGMLLLLTGDTRLALLSLSVFFFLGGVVLYFVDVEKGVAQAKRS